MTRVLNEKEIIVGVSGGIAAYKSAELVRRLVKAGARVRVLMTRNAERFIGRATLAALSNRPVCIDLFADADTPAAIGHIQWAEAAQAVILAPATANLIGKLANGIADDALTTLMLAVRCPVFVCPAMNTDMYEHPATQRNIDRLVADGCRLIEPDAGELACGRVGPGRLPDPEAIVAAVASELTPKDLIGRRVLVTAGPTVEAIDPVRYITNPSSGKTGFAVADAASRRGAEVILITGPTVQPDPPGVSMVRVRTALEMAEAFFRVFDTVDVVVKTAAVSDFRPERVSDHKIKKDAAEARLVLVRNPDILAEAGTRKRSQLLVGFAAETDQLAVNARMKLERKHLDMIVGNRVGPDNRAFGSDTNAVSFFFPDGSRRDLDLCPKTEIAEAILDAVLERLAPSAAGDRR